MPTPAAQIFRAEAVEAREQSPGDRGAPIELLPHWVGRLYWLILAAVSVAVTYSLSASVGEYAEGAAVVRVEGRLDLATPFGGVVRSVDVQPGDRVKKGQILVRFQTGSEELELERLDSEVEAKLARLLLNPSDEGTRQSFASLRAARDLAAGRIKERAVVALRDGVVGNMRIRPGQSLAPGDVAATLVDDGNTVYSVLALVPGQFRPMLKRGMKMRFGLEGFPQIYAWMPIDLVGDEVVGPSEVKRFLGQELGDTLAVAGGFVLVRARLPNRGFVFEGRAYNYYDGIPGKVDIRVRSTPLVSLLFPALKRVFSHAL